jgi:hypothetical protein
VLIVEPEQGPFQHVSRPPETITTADRENLFPTQPRRLKTRQIAVAVAHRNVDVLAGKVDTMRCRRDPELDAGLRRGEASQPMHQPFRREIWRYADGENSGALLVRQSRRASTDVVERLADLTA